MNALKRTSLAWIAIVFIAIFPSTHATSGAEGAGEIIADPTWLRERLEKIRRDYHLPALAASVVIDGKVVAASAVGVRRWRSDERVTRDDPFYLGSVTKPMTATMLFKLVDRGVLHINWTEPSR